MDRDDDVDVVDCTGGSRQYLGTSDGLGYSFDDDDFENNGAFLATESAAAAAAAAAADSSATTPAAAPLDARFDPSWEDALTEMEHQLKFGADPTETILRINEQLNGLLLPQGERGKEGAFPAPPAELSPQEEFALRRAMPRTVAALVRRGDLPQLAVDTTEDFFETCACICARFSETKTMVSEVYGTFGDIVDFNKLFHERFGCSRGSRTPQMAIALFNTFFRHKGFDGMTRRVADQSAPLSVDEIRTVLRPCNTMRRYLTHSFIGTFSDALAPGVRSRLSGVTVEDLKVEKRDAIANLCQMFTNILRGTTDLASRVVDEMNLHFDAMLMTIPVLEKRFAGIRDIAAYAADIGRVHGIMITRTEFAQWLLDNRIVENLFDKSAHVELIRRSSDVLRLMAQEGALTQESLDLVWATAMSGAHESIQVAVFNLLGDLAHYLGALEWEYVDAKISQLPLHSFATPHFLSLAKIFAQSAVGRAPYTDSLVGTAAAGAKPPAAPAATDVPVSAPVPVVTPPGCMNVLWQLAQETSPASIEVAADVQASLAAIISHRTESKLRAHYLGLVIENLRNHKSVTESLNVLVKTLAPRCSEGGRVGVWEKKDESDALHKFNEEHGFFKLFLDDLRYFKEAARAAGVKKGEDTLPGHRVPYLSQIKERLEFMKIVMTTCEHIKLGMTEMEIVWENLVANALIAQEREKAFSMMIHLGSKATAELQPIPDAVAVDIFERKFAMLNVEDLLESEYDFFNYFFRYLNWRKDRFQEVSPGNTWVIKAPWNELVGINVLWKLALEVSTPQVGKKATADLIKTLTNVWDKLRSRVPELRELFLQRCVTVLSTAQNDRVLARALKLVNTVLEEMRQGMPFAGQHDSRCRGPAFKIMATLTGANATRHEVEVHTCDTIGELKTLLVAKIPGAIPGFALVANGKSFPNPETTLQHAGIRPGVLVHVVNKPKEKDVANGNDKEQDKGKGKGKGKSKDATTTTTTAAATTTKPASPKPAEAPKRTRTQLKGVMVAPETYDMFYRFLGNDEVAELAWEVLVSLPSDQRLLKAFEEAGTPELPAKSWSDLLPRSNEYTLLYSLAIVESLSEEAMDANEELKRASWRQDFLAKGGAAHLLQLLMSLAATPVDTTPRACHFRECISKLTRALQSCLLLDQNTRFNDSLLSSGLVATDALVRRLMDNTLAMASVPMTYIFSSDESDLSKSSMTVAVAALLAHLDIASAIVVEGGDSGLPLWLHKTMLETSRAEVRRSVSSAFLLLCSKAFSLRPALGDSIFGILVSFLDQTIAKNPAIQTCADYFALLSKLVDESVQAGHPVDAPKLLTHIIALIKSHPVVETRDGSVEDKAIQGLLTFAGALIKAAPEMQLRAGQELGLVQELYDECLYNIPSRDNHGPLAPPKCKTTEARTAAFALLIELCRGCEPNLEAVRDRLFRRITTLDSLHVGWQYQPGGVERAACGYSGLRNLGATCYCNSILQQLYMHPGFRRGLLSVEKPVSQSPSPTAAAADSKRVPEEKLLERLQTLFGFMQESERRAQDPAEFIKTLKHDGQPVNPLIQMDAEEFLANLFDKLEEQLKGTPQEKLVQSTFGGTICHQLVPTGCTHVREREEGFYTLQVVVQGKKNLQESLEAFIGGEMLNGDNQYMCEECKVKRDTLKRCFLDKLPQTLFIHLKRFEFDLEDMRRIKVNDEYSFPTVLNLDQYTRDGIAAKEKGESVHVEGCEYELAGIVVHLGTADSGHYYSYIRERDTAEPRWLHFNDTGVEIFDPTQIPVQCFGGAEPYSSYSYSRQSQKMYNAYMLVYQRRSPDVVMKDVDPAPAAVQSQLPTRTASVPVPKPIFEAIWEENVRFLEDKHTFSAENFNFIWDIVTLGLEVEAAKPAPTLADEHALRNYILATRFLFDTMAHAKEHAAFRDCTTRLGDAFVKNIPACMWLLTTCATGDWPKQLLLECPADDVRSAVADFFGRVLAAAYPLCEAQLLEFEQQAEPVATVATTTTTTTTPPTPAEANPIIFTATGKPKTPVTAFMEKIVEMLRTVHLSWRSFGQFFLVFEHFAKLGAKARDYLLQRHVLAQLLDLFLAEKSPFAKYTPKRTKMGDKFANPFWSHLVGAVVSIAHSCGPLAVFRKAATPEEKQKLPCAVPDVDLQMLATPGWYIKALTTGTGSNVVAEFLLSLVAENVVDSDAAVEALAKGIDETDSDELKPFFDVTVELLRLEDSLHQRRTEAMLKRILEVIVANAQYAKATQATLRFVSNQLSSLPLCRAWLWANRSQWIEKWLLTFTPDATRELASTTIAAISGCTAPPAGPFTPEQMQAEPELLSTLLDLVPAAIRNITTYDSLYDTHAPPKYTYYARLLARSMCVSGIAEHDKLLAARIGDFLKLLWEVDLARRDTDEVKHELTNALLDVLANGEGMISTTITACPDIANKLLSFHVFIRPIEYYRTYNRKALATLYQLVDLVSQKGSSIVLPSKGIEFAVTNVVLDSNDYPEAAATVMGIIKRLSKESPAAYRAIHDQFLPLAATHTHISINCLQILRFVSMLLDAPAESALFCEKKGLTLLTTAIDQESPTNTPDTAPALQLCFELAQRALQWTLLPEFAERKAALLASVWDADRAAKLVWALVSAYRRHPHLAKGAAAACELALGLLPVGDALFHALTEGLLTARLPLKLTPVQEAAAKEATLSFRKLVRGVFQRSLPTPNAVSLALALVASEPDGGDEDSASDLLLLHTSKPEALSAPTLEQEKLVRVVVAPDRKPLGPKSLSVLSILFGSITEATAEFVDDVLAALKKEIETSKNDASTERLRSAAALLSALAQSTAFRVSMHKSALSAPTLALLADPTLPQEFNDTASRITQQLQQTPLPPPAAVAAAAAAEVLPSSPEAMQSDADSQQTQADSQQTQPL